MNLKLKRTPGIYVVGFVAAGKSTIGRRLADRLGWSFFDTDEEIEKAEKTTVAEIFATRGEADFRRMESAILRDHVRSIERGRPAVLALGGGASLAPENRAMLEDHGITVWLYCPFDKVKERVARAADRPLAHDPEKFQALYEARREFYGLAAVRIAISSDDPEAAVDAMVRHPGLL